METNKCADGRIQIYSQKKDAFDWGFVIQIDMEDSIHTIVFKFDPLLGEPFWFHTDSKKSENKS